MWMDAERDDEEYDRDSDASDEVVRHLSDHGAYWRRRFLLLCAGIVALGVCAWLLPGARQAHGTSAAAQASMAAAATSQSLPPAASGPAWSSPAPTPSPSPSPTGSAKLATSTQKITASYDPRPTGSPTATSTAPGQADAPCPAADIVLSLFTTQASYDQQAPPSFTVYAVSTAATGCTLTYGSGAVQVIVTNHGQVVWNSAACDPPAAKKVLFTLGVPQVLTVTWNRATASPSGCGGALPAGFTGTLQAVAMSHGQSSPVRTFKVVKPAG